MTELQGVFTEIYSSGGKVWKGIESKSGRGSDMATTVRIREMLPVILRALGVGSILDAGCGDWNWMSKVDLSDVAYHGCDIVPALIQENIQRYSSSKLKRKFFVADLTKDPLPPTDLILCRSVLFHLCLSNVNKVLANFRSSGARWLLTTTYPYLGKPFVDIKDGGFHWLNLQDRPFGWPEPHLFICEGSEHEGYLGLWKMSEIP